MKYLSLLVLILLTSCTAMHREWDEFYVYGNVKEGRYYDKNGFFSIALPQSCYNAKLDDYHTTDSCTILLLTFKNEERESFEHCRLEVERGILKGYALTVQDIKRIYYQGYYREAVKNCTAAKVKDEGVINDEKGLCMYFCLSGKTKNYLSETDEYADVIQECLIFQQGSLGVTICIEEPYSPSLTTPEQLQEIESRLKNRIFEIRSSFEVTHN